MRERARRRAAPSAWGPRGPFSGREPDRDPDGAEIEEDADQPRQHARDEEPADVGARDDAVEDEDHRRGNEDAERAAGGDGAGREAVGIGVLSHLRHGDLRHRRRGRHARPAHGREPAAGQHRRHGEPAAPVPDEGVGALVELAAEAGPGDEVAHQDEERQH